MHFAYRHCGVPDDVIFTEALFQGMSGDPAAIAAEMDKITQAREATQPVQVPYWRFDLQEPARRKRRGS